MTVKNGCLMAYFSLYATALDSNQGFRFKVNVVKPTNAFSKLQNFIVITCKEHQENKNV